jgi:hypothetical protein
MTVLFIFGGIAIFVYTHHSHFGLAAGRKPSQEVKNACLSRQPAQKDSAREHDAKQPPHFFSHNLTSIPSSSFSPPP